MIARTKEEQAKLRAAGKLLAQILRELAERTHAGVSAAELDIFAEKRIREEGALPVFLNYDNGDCAYPYPATLCVSLNDEVVHGIPTETKVFKDGDIVSLDLGLSLEGYVVDAAVTVIVGQGTKDLERLLEGTKKSIAAGIKAAHAGATFGDVGAAIAAAAKECDLTVVRDLGGHGTGRKLHEEPFVANFGTKGQGDKLVSGMVLAFEPILTLGGGAIVLDDDEWTYKTKDGSCAAHFEHTILVGEKGAEILTQ